MPVRNAARDWPETAVLCLLFQVPIYAAIIALNGASMPELIQRTWGATIIMLALVRP